MPNELDNLPVDIKLASKKMIFSEYNTKLNVDALFSQDEAMQEHTYYFLNLTY